MVYNHMAGLSKGQKLFVHDFPVIDVAGLIRERL
jgi:hypothetical protein